MSTDTQHPAGPGLVAGRYRTERAVGRGGMGTVWLARDERLGRQVALKQLAAFPGETEGHTQRAMREARHAAALNHPNVVAVYDVVEHEGAPWLVMEYVDGPTLSQAVQERGPLLPRGAADLGAQLAAALASAHAAGVVHRDIKPANVLIGNRRPKLADFGTARAGGDDQITRTGLVTGTPTYMAPEVADGHDPSQASDLWALGATLYFAVEGRDAYQSQGNPLATLRHIATTEPEPLTRGGELAPVIERLMDRDPARRGDAATARADLERIAATPGGSSPLRPQGQSNSAARERRSWLPWLLAAAAALVVAGVVTALALTQGEDRSAGTASPSSSSAPTSASPSPSESPSESSTPTSVSSTSPSTTSSPTSSTSSTSSTSTAPTFPAAEVTDFVESHYATLAEDPGRAWSNLTPAMQETAGGRGDYVALWSRFDSIAAQDITVDEQTGTASFTLTRTLRADDDDGGDDDDDDDPAGGEPTSDRRTVTVVRSGQSWKIDAAS